MTSDTSFTCSFANVSDTCTVTVPAPSYSLAFSQDTYTYTWEDDNVTVSCTLTSGGTPVSGETITFSYTAMGLPFSETAITNSNGVATLTIDYPGDTTVTATYQGASASCTVEEIF